MPTTFRSKKGKNGKRVSFPIIPKQKPYVQPFMRVYVVQHGKKESSDVPRTFKKKVLGYKIMLVDKNYVKKRYRLDFFYAGHGRALKFIPIDEIWIGRESHLEADTFHEIIETELMKEGMEYTQEGSGAHSLAEQLEKKLKADGNWEDREKYLRGITEEKVRSYL